MPAARNADGFGSRASKVVGPIAHTKYRNNVALKTDGDRIVIYGDEAAGKYVEHVSMKTGKTVADKKL